MITRYDQGMNTPHEALSPDHPAVEAAALKYLNTRRGNGVHDAIAAALTAALPDLTAATEENLARLRNTPAGRALRAEGWERGLGQGYKGGLEWATVVPSNPYLEGDA